MATQYGYRLFRLELYKGNARRPTDFTRATQTSGDIRFDVPAMVREVCERHLNETFDEPLRFVERVQPDDDAAINDPDAEIEDTTPMVRLTQVVRHHNRVDIKFRHGRKGSHDLALSAMGEDDDADLRNRASSNEFRAHLYFPEEGTYGLLVCEARGRVCPYSDLLRVVGVKMKHWVEEMGKHDPGATITKWWKLKASPLVDDERIHTSIRQGRAVGIRLTKYGIAADGMRQRPREWYLQTDRIAPENASPLRHAAARWTHVDPQRVGLTEEDVREPEETEVRHMAAYMGAEVDPEDFDEAAIIWEDPEGAITTIRPDDHQSLYIYPVGPRGRYPSDQVFRQAAEARFPRLLAAAQIRLPNLQ